MPPRLDPEIEAHINSAGEEAGREAIEFGSEAQSTLSAVGNGLMGALGSVPGQIGAMAEAPFAAARFLEHPIDNSISYFGDRSTPQLAADAVGLGALGAPNPVVSGLISGTSRGLANAYEMPEGTPFNDRLEQFTTDAFSPFAMPMVGGTTSAVTKKVSGPIASRLKEAPLSDRLATSVIFTRAKRIDEDALSAGELKFAENAAVKMFREDGVLQGPSAKRWVANYYGNLNKLEGEVEGILSKPVGPAGESLGSASASVPIRMGGATGASPQPIFTKAEQFIQDSKVAPSTRALMEEQLNEWRQTLTGFDLPDGTQVPGVATINDLQKAKRSIYNDNSSMYRRMGQNPENIPPELEQLTRKAAQDVVEMLNDSISQAAGKYGTKAQELAAKFAPTNKKWGTYLDALKDFRRLADVSTNPVKQLNLRTAAGGGLGGMAGSVVGMPVLGSAMGGTLATPSGMAAASWGANIAENVGQQLGNAMAPLSGPMGAGAGMLGATLNSPRAMGAVSSFDQLINQGMPEAQAQQSLPRTPEGVMANPVAIMQLLPPEMHGQFQAALEGGNDSINKFMSNALVTVPGLAEQFVPSRVSPEEFGGQFQDPMATFDLYQDVTSQMLRGDMDPRKAYKAQKAAVQGKVPKTMQ